MYGLKNKNKIKKISYCGPYTIDITGSEGISSSITVSRTASLQQNLIREDYIKEGKFKRDSYVVEEKKTFRKKKK